MPLNSSSFPPDHALPAQPAAHGITRQLVVVMGVCGSGKTTIAEGLHNELGWPWLDADTLHEPASIAKMRDGIPLTDADRSAWLERCHAWLRGCAERNTGGILACSASNTPTATGYGRRDWLCSSCIYMRMKTSCIRG